jgi:Bifunctional DNA primase/polymerase, N-terminal
MNSASGTSLYQSANEAESTTQAAKLYLRKGLQLIGVSGKSPSINGEGWEQKRVTLETVERDIPTHRNVSIMPGEPSGWLVDVDLDITEAAAASKVLLPESLRSGRAGAPGSHWWAIAKDAQTTRILDLYGKTCVEIRSTGCQTVAPPSYHPDTGERIRWENPDQALYEIPAEKLLYRVRMVATAAILSQAMPPVGGRHYYAMAAAGFLLRKGLPAKVVKLIIRAAWSTKPDVERNTEKELDGIVDDTSRKLEKGENVIGGSRLAADYDDRLPGAIARVWRW